LRRVKPGLGSQEAIDWIPGLPHFLCPHARQSTLHTGQPLGGATRGFACTPGEGARDAASFRGTRHKSPHRPTSPISLSPLTLPLTLLSLTTRRFLFHRRLHRRRRPYCLAASSLLPRIVVAEVVPRIEGRQASGRTSTTAYKMSVSTLNPHLVHLVSLLDVRRHALDDMHSRSARFRVEGHYYSAEVFPLSSR
jgi:hypothetical protein